MLYRLLLLAFSNDSVFGVSIENDAFSDVSVFKSLHFEQRFQMSPFSIVFNGNTNPKTETFHSVFIRKRSNGNGASIVRATSARQSFQEAGNHRCHRWIRPPSSFDG